MLLEGGKIMKKDFYGKEAYLRYNVLQTIENVYKNYGFDSLCIPLLEELDNNELQQTAFELVNNSGGRYKLKYDSTLSLSKFISTHSDIRFPYKVYQLQKSFRNMEDNSLNEFCQCDVDIVGSKSLTSDAEIIEIASQGLHEVGMRNYKIRLNHSKIIEEIKKDSKIGQALAEIFESKTNEKALFTEIKTKFSDNENIVLGINEIEKIFSIIPSEIRKNCSFDINTTVVSNYYTGIVFDGCIDDTILLHGGRYNNLIKNTAGNALPSVGMAYTLENIIEVLDKHDVKVSFNNKIVFYLENEKISISKPLIGQLRDKYPVLTVNSEDMDMEEFINLCKDQSARLIAVVENDNMELYKIDEFEKKVKDTKTYKIGG